MKKEIIAKCRIYLKSKWNNTVGISSVGYSNILSERKHRATHLILLNFYPFFKFVTVEETPVKWIVNCCYCITTFLAV